MDIQAYRDEIKLRLTGYVVGIELEDQAIDGCINAAFRQVQRYIDETAYATIPYSGCINLSGKGVSSVSRVYRTEGYMASPNSNNGTSASYDPMYMAAWQQMSGGTGAGISNITNWVENIASYNTMLQVRNTLSTDLTFRYDKHREWLYINIGFDTPQYITIEYIPRYKDVSEIVSDYWIDIEMRLALAICKQVIGRIRKKFTQSNALWSLDVDILTEGLEEEKELQEIMRKASQLCYPID